MEDNVTKSRIEQIDISLPAARLRRMWNGVRLNYLSAFVGLIVMIGPTRYLFDFDTSWSAKSLYVLLIMLTLQLPVLVLIVGSLSRFAIGFAVLLYLIDLLVIVVVGSLALDSSDTPALFYIIFLGIIAACGLVTILPVIVGPKSRGPLAVWALARYNRRINRWPIWWLVGRVVALFIMTMFWTFAVMIFQLAPKEYHNYAVRAAAKNAGGVADIPTMGEVFLAFSSVGVGLILMVMAIGVPVILCIRLARRWLLRRTEGRAAKSAREPILLLRSFADDEARVRPNHLGMRFQFRKMRLEEVVASIIAPIGTFVGIGMPNEHLPQLGAQRAYFEDDTWQDAVLDWISKSRFVVMITGVTPWVQWELRTLIEQSGLKRLVVLIPPADPEMTERRLKLIRECFAGTDWAASLTDLDPERIVALLFLEDGLTVVMNGRHRDEIEYRLTMLATMQRIGIELPK